MIDSDNMPLPENIERVTDAFRHLYTLLSCLRGPDGCPWDREQSIESMKKNLVEESYEYIDAHDNGTIHDVKEELGDIFLVATMISIIHHEYGQFSPDEIFLNTYEKLIRRHPHVFTVESVQHAEEVLSLWDSVKEQERASSPKRHTNIFEKIPTVMPTLLQTREIQKIVRGYGFDWDKTSDVIDKAIEELQELKQELKHLDDESSKETIKEEFGDVMFSLVNLSRFLKVDADLALRSANSKFIERFLLMQELMQRSSVTLSKDTPLKVMDTYWEQAKSILKKD